MQEPSRDLKPALSLTIRRDPRQPRLVRVGRIQPTRSGRDVGKKPKSYKDESDGCIDTWIEVMKLHFEEENLSKKQECSTLTSNLEGTAQAV